MGLSFLTGVLVSGSFSLQVLPAFAAICLLINSKQALTLWWRAKPSSGRHAAAFFFQVGLASVIFLSLVRGSFTVFLPYTAVPIAYILLNRYAGEHAIYTEVAGFALLAMAAPLAKFFCTGQLDSRLYIAVAVFFCAGVFKVRVQLRKGIRERSAMCLYLVFAAAVYYAIKAPFPALLPLLDNLIFAATLYKMKLRAAGWTEVSKGVMFLLLMSLFY